MIFVLKALCFFVPASAAVSLASVGGLSLYKKDSKNLSSKRTDNVQYLKLSSVVKHENNNISINKNNNHIKKNHPIICTGSWSHDKANYNLLYRAVKNYLSSNGINGKEHIVKSENLNEKLSEIQEFNIFKFSEIDSNTRNLIAKSVIQNCPAPN